MKVTLVAIHRQLTRGGPRKLTITLPLFVPGIMIGRYAHPDAAMCSTPFPEGNFYHALVNDLSVHPQKKDAQWDRGLLTKHPTSWMVECITSWMERQ